MRIKLFSILITLLLSNFIFAQAKIQSLTLAEKQADFDFLYQELKATYPYFGVNQRKHQLDWLANQELYLQKIKATKNDTEFYLTLSDILNDLNNGHTDMLPTFYYEYFSQGYEQAIAEAPEYQAYVDELKKGNAAKKYKHWIKIKDDLSKQEQNEAADSPTSDNENVQANVETTLDHTNSIAILKINSFSYEFIENDQPLIADFLKRVRSYQHLIIDIQGNTGGDDHYWQSNIIGNLIAEVITFPVTIAFKPSSKIKTMKPNYQANLVYENIDLPNLPAELKTGEYEFMNWENSVEPNPDGVNFEGKIYLLVDDEVFSSAETLAYFCKATQFATVAGIQTNGDGIGSDPLLITLPNSGIVIRFTGEMALNPDGSSNEEMRTIPDIILEGDTKNERLEKLKERIIQK